MDIQVKKVFYCFDNPPLILYERRIIKAIKYFFNLNIHYLKYMYESYIYFLSASSTVDNYNQKYDFGNKKVDIGM